MPVTALPSTEPLHPDEQALVQYSAVSRTAIAALALGLASPLFLVTPLLIIVPLAGVVVAAVALRQIATSEGQLKGTWPATIGLCLATMLLGWGLTHQVTRQATLAAQAERFADGWLALVREGKLQRADQLMRSSDERSKTEEEMAEHYKSNRESNENLQSFFEREPMKGFRAAGPQASYRMESVTSQSHYGMTDYIVLEYRYEGPGGGVSGSGGAPMWITVQRTARGAGRAADWKLQAVAAEMPEGS